MNAKQGPLLATYLAENTLNYEAWIDEPTARAAGCKHWEGATAPAIVAHFKSFIWNEFSGDLQDLQLRYTTNHACDAHVLRASSCRLEEPSILYQSGDLAEMNQATWADLPFAMLGPFLQVPDPRAAALLRPVDELLRREYEGDRSAMITNFQARFEADAEEVAPGDLIASPDPIEIRRRRRIIILIGAWGWEPPSRHLHILIVIAGRFVA